MSNGRPSVPDALLRLGALAAATMAGLHLWLAWAVQDWPADGPMPQPLQSVAIAEFMLWFLLVPAAVVVGLRWRATRDRRLALLALVCVAAVAASLAGWRTADTAGAWLVLNLADAALSLLGAGAAIRALRLR